MNPDTGHLVRQLTDEKKREGYDPIPRSLEPAAQRKLAGKDEAQVNLKSRSSLAEWARKKRLAKLAAKSRRRNRR